MLNVERYLTPEAATAISRHIEEAGGNEVFLVGYLNDDRRVESVEVFARGNEASVPALMQVARTGEVVIHNHPSGPLKPSGADVHVASALGNDGIGFYIVNNAVSDIFVVVESFPKKDVLPVNTAELTQLIDKQGAVSKKLQNYEYRPQQIEMLEIVGRAMNQDEIAIVEAGTGTGKTLAYLLPAIQYAINNKERIVVSTNTINLQEQLIHKDLPFLKSILNEKFNAVLVKGRTNYGCKRKLLEAGQELDLFSEEGDKSELQAIVAWSKGTRDGSKSDLNIEPRREVWEKIQSESDTSLKTKCPYYNECFFYSARRKAATADILVSNHHLLFSDLALRSVFGGSENAVLPAYDRIILDEAHNIEDVATSYFGAGITYLGVLRILGRLFNRKDGQEKGLLPFLLHKLTKYAFTIPHETFEKAQDFVQLDAVPEIEKLRSLLTETMEHIFYTVRGERDSQYGEIKLRLTGQVLDTEPWHDKILVGAKNLVKELRRFSGRVGHFTRALSKVKYKLGPAVGSMTIDLKAQSDRLEAAAKTIEHVLLNADETHTRWVEVREGYKSSKIVRLRSAPLDVAPILKDKVYDKFKNVLMTSATLTVEGRFDYLKSRLGLDLVDSKSIDEKSLPAPFDYKKQALVGIPADVPDPRDRGFAETLPKLLLNSVEISRGRAFILFTSYGLLNMMFNRLKPEIEKLGYNVYKQGQENRHRLLERFKADTGSVLFATDSFWEGVDVEGESLESVIIVKLPFRVPSEPIVEARVEAIERRGGNAFLEFTVPQAAIKFKQGFGRLIRRKTDRGSVLILDKRVIQKSYGQVFLNSLPETRIVTGPSEQVFRELTAFYRSD